MNKIELENEILKHRDAYYNKSVIISDADYDKLEDELRAIDSTNPLLLGIGTDSTDGFSKRTHMMIMGSQDKMNSEVDLKGWLRVKDIQFPVVVEHKLDGLSLELQYVNSRLVAGVTRGNGEVGDEIPYENLVKIPGVITHLLDDATCAVRGEVIMFNGKFVNKYKKLDFKNSRNSSAGVLKRKTGEGYPDLNLIVYDTSMEFPEEMNKIQFLINNGFHVVDHTTMDNVDNLINYIAKESVERKNLDYEIDGLVVKQNKTVKENRLRPEYQRAYKFENEEEETELKGIEWSRSGFNYTPVAILAPVELAGATITRASLANLDEVKRLGIRVGDTVRVSRRNDVIPKVEEVVEHIGTEEIQVVSKCEVCGEYLTITGTGIYCENKACRSYKEHRLYKWIDTLGVKGFGDALITYILTLADYDDIDSLYSERLFKSVFAGTNLVKATEKAFKALYAVGRLNLETFLAGLDINSVGEKQWKKVVGAGFNTIDKIYQVQFDELTKIDGIALKLATAMLDGLEDTKPLIDKILATNLVVLKDVQDVVLIPLGTGLNASFCFTGSLDTMKRADAQKMVTDKGGQVKDSVAKGLTYLVTNDKDSGSSKNTKAQSLGVTIINEQEFLELIK